MISESWLRLLAAARAERGWTEALAAAGSPEALLGADASRLEALGVGSAARQRLRASTDETALAPWREWLAGPNRGLVTFGTADYPPLLAALPDPPLALWVHGPRVESLRGPQIAIVGSRNATRSGSRTAREFAREFATRGLTITSGLATGIDTSGHIGCLDAGGTTIAVLGCGIDRIFPRENRNLAARIAEHGLIVSEYPPGVAPLPHHFPARNRIIAGLAVGTLVVEAGPRSGSLITARLAAECGREVFAVPGSIHNPLARGCHKLIREGAKLVEDSADVLVELAPLLALDAGEAPPDRAAAAPEPLGDDYDNLMKLIDFDVVPIHELSVRSGLTTAELSSMLLVLELEGFVEALPGGRYCRLSKRGR